MRTTRSIHLAPLTLALGLGALASLSWSATARAAPAYATAPADEEPGEKNGAPSPVRPVRAGVLAGIGFPRPLSIEAMAELSGWIAIGAEYGMLPSVTIHDVSTNLWSLAADVRVFPFHNAFFIGLRAGRQHVGADTDVSVPMLGSAHETLGLDSWFVNPRIGILWTSREGFSLGIEAGLQIPISPTITSTLPLSLDPSAEATIRTLGSSVLPTVDLLRIGMLF